MPSSSKPCGWAELPEPTLQSVFQLLSPDSLVAASRTCRSWQAICYYSGAVSRTILTPLLPLLRDRFGVENLPIKISVTTLRKLLVLYNRQDALGKSCSTTFYDISTLTSPLVSSPEQPSTSSEIPPILRRTALISGLFGVLTKPRRILLFDTSTTPLRYLATYKARDSITTFSLSGSYLAVITHSRNLHIYQLIGRTTREPSLYEDYCIPLPSDPDSGAPISVALTPVATGIPLAAVLTTTQVWLVHRNHVITLRRENDFFRPEALSNGGGTMTDVKNGKMPQKQLSARTRTRRKKEPWLLKTDIVLPENNAHSSSPSIAPIKFTLHGQQLQIGSLSLFLGTHVLDATVKTTPDSLFAFFEKPNHWVVHPFPPSPLDGPRDGYHYVAPKGSSSSSSSTAPAANMDDASDYIYTNFLHLHAEYYITTCIPGSGLSAAPPNSRDANKTTKTNTTTSPAPHDARIISLSPITNRATTKLILFRLPPTSEHLVPRYAVHHPPSGGAKSGYLAFMPAEGRLDILPIALIPFEPDNSAPDDSNNNTTGEVESDGGFSFSHSDSVGSQAALDEPSATGSTSKRRGIKAGQHSASKRQTHRGGGGPEERGWELVQQCRDVPIGNGVGELVEIVAQKDKVVVLGAEGMVVVKLFDGDDAGRGIEGGGRVDGSGGNARHFAGGGGHWWVDERGRVKSDVEKQRKSGCEIM